MSARPGPCGGHRATGVPTAIVSNEPDRRIRDGTKLGFLSYPTIEDGHENSEGFFDRFSDWDCGWVGVMGVRHRANHLARSSSICLLSADPCCDHRDSDYLASANRNEFTAIAVKAHYAQNQSMSAIGILRQSWPDVAITLVASSVAVSFASSALPSAQYPDCGLGGRIKC